MNSLTEQAAQVLVEIDAELAICEKRIGDENNLRKLAAKYDADDALDTAITGVPCSDEVQKDLRDFATFIASARTVCPKSLRCLKTAIEVFLVIVDVEIDKHGQPEVAGTVAAATLDSLITQWNSK